MAHFSYLSSPESDNSAVEDIISQAKDLRVLEQIAALNSPHSSYLLPPHLETRFTRLKSLPPSLPVNIPHDFNTPISQNQPIKTPSSSPPSPTAHSQIPAPKRTADTEAPSLSVKSEEKHKGPPLKSGTGSFSSPPISLSLPPVELEPPSPPPQLCCCWISPKKITKKKKTEEDWAAELDLDDGFLGKKDEILSDLGSFSLKEQRRRLKKAWKEEEKVTREAEKIVKWAREASARIEASAIEDLTSDDDEKFE